jgi:hypothetical protein
LNAGLAFAAAALGFAAAAFGFAAAAFGFAAAALGFAAAALGFAAAALGFAAAALGFAAAALGFAAAALGFAAAALGFAAAALGFAAVFEAAFFTAGALVFPGAAVFVIFAIIILLSLDAKILDLFNNPVGYFVNLRLACKSCKMFPILLFFSGCCSETEVSEQLSPNIIIFFLKRQPLCTGII